MTAKKASKKKITAAKAKRGARKRAVVASAGASVPAPKTFAEVGQGEHFTHEGERYAKHDVMTATHVNTGVQHTFPSEREVKRA